MAEIPNTNLDNVEGKMPLLAVGPAGFAITNSQVKNSKAGNPKLRFSLEVVEGPDEGKSAVIEFSLMPKALWKLRTFRDAVLGETYKQGGDTLDSSEFHGRKFRGIVSHKDLTDENSNPYKINEIDGYAPMA